MRFSLAAACLLALALVAGCSRAPVGTPAEERVRGFCGTCHGLSDPGLLPRREWRAVIERMAVLYDVDGKQALPASVDECVAYFEAGAPEEAPLPTDGWCQTGTLAVRVRRIAVKAIAAPIAGIHLAGWNPDARVSVPPVFSPALGHAGALAVADLDGDGLPEVLLNTPGPEGPDGVALPRLTAMWSRSGAFYANVLTDADEDGVPIGALAVGDLDGDGDADLAAAQPGDFRHGDLFWLEQRAGDDGREFRTHRIDPRSGANAVEIADMNGDGALDVVACFGAQFETVVAFLQRGRGYFEAVTLFEAPNADYGCRDIVVADLDGDGDLDVVLAAGEVGPSPVVQPFHGVYLLENQGGLAFEVRMLVRLPGAARVEVGDVDGDGDLDIVAAAWLPDMDGLESVNQRASLVLLERTAAGTFEPLALERGRFIHSALALADVDGDGAAEIVVASGAVLEVFDLPAGPR